MKVFMLGMLLLVLAGCADKPRVMYNMGVPHQDEPQQFKIDHGQCVMVANGSAPMPPVAYTPTGGKTTYGSFSAYSPGRPIFGNYSSTSHASPGDSFMAGVTNGAAIGAMFAAKQARQDIYEGCMARLGWKDGERPRLAEGMANKAIPQSSPLKEAEWKYVCSAEGTTSKFWGRADAIITEGDLRLFQLVHLDGTDEATTMLVVGDCADRTVALTEMVFVDMGTGKELRRVKYAPDNMDVLEAKPGTVQQAWIDFACGQ